MTRVTIDMMEVTRLTREGRLADAMAVLREGCPSPSATSTDRARPGQTARMPVNRTATMPSMRSGVSSSSPHVPGETKRDTGGMQIPKSLRGFLDRMGQLAPGCGPKGLSGRPVKYPPAPLPDGARFEERVYANTAGSRTYKLYVPSGYKGRALPLVVMLHGCTQSPDDFAAGTRMNEVAEEQIFFVAYPAQAQSANASKCWNWFNAGDQLRDQGEPSLIAGITREIVRDLAVAPGRIYIAGLSAGGAAAAIMGATYPDLYAAVGVHSGLACGAARDMPSAFAAMKQGASPARQASRRQESPVPTIVFHGDRDTTVNPVNADEVIAQAKAAMDLRSTISQGVADGGKSFTRAVHASADGKPVLEQWVVHGAGHAWSGGSAAGSYTDSRGPDASREMIRFFLAQDHCRRDA